MGEVTILIQTLTKYVEQLTKSPNWIDNFARNGAPILQLLVVAIGSACAVIRYYYEKNREINEKMLKEVYSPLYAYFVKQELYCHLFSNINYKERPICELISEKTKTQICSDGTLFQEKNKKIELELGRHEFIKTLDSVNIGLASKELYTLLNMYKMLIYIDETSKNGGDKQLKSKIVKLDVENELRKEIISGYKFYHKKLNLPEITKNNFYEITEDNIEYKFNIDEKLIEKLKHQDDNTESIT